MPRVMLIHNPVAARTTPATLDSVLNVFSSAGWQVTPAETTRPEDSQEFARQGVKDGFDVIAVYGGDGTTIQAISGTIGSETPFGLIPGGTGNLLAGNLRLPRNPAAAARVIVEGKPRPVDLGRLTCGGKVKYFSVGCGTGFDAEIMTETSEEAKRRFRMFAYVAKTIEVLGRLEPKPHRVTIDGHTREVDLTSIVVANCGEIIPPILRWRAGISLDDGLFDIVLISASNYLECIEVLLQMLSGNSNGRGRIEFATGRRIEVETDEPRPVELDGDGAGVTPFVAEVVPGGIEVLMPNSVL